MTSLSHSSKRVIFSADDFGMSIEVNDAIERAHLEGVLSTTSLMVAGPAAQDAITRAKRLPHLKVGLHLVVIEGDSILKLPTLTNKKGWFPSNQLLLGIRYFFLPHVRQALKKEIHAQFEAFQKTGLNLDHANAHKHMHLHPVIGKYLISIGKLYGLKSVRTPCEPCAPLAAKESYSDNALRHWTKLLRSQIRKANMTTNDHCFGIRWSGKMTTDKMTFLLPRLPEGVSEIYFHPAIKQNLSMKTLMPGYDQRAEMTALIAPQTKEAVKTASLQEIGWADI